MKLLIYPIRPIKRLSIMFLDEKLSADDYSEVKGQLLRAINNNRGWYLMQWEGCCKVEDEEMLIRSYWRIKSIICGQYELLNDLNILCWDTYSELCNQFKERMRNIANCYGKEI